jgi:C-terminal processing protease CtpA/Prc
MLAKYRTLRFLLMLGCAAIECRAQLTTEQKLYDFRQMTAYYQYAYAPQVWKKQVFGFDLRDTAPWLDRVQRSVDDLEFYEICYEYVASLNDSHSKYQMRANWAADLGFTVDNYDAGPGAGPEPVSGVVLIDSIDRSRLPADQFPFQIGDELLSVDGVSVEDWIRRLSKWVANSSSRAKRSVAAQGIVSRSQAGSPIRAPFPRAPLETKESAIVQIRRQSGAIETYTIKWQKGASGGPGGPGGPGARTPNRPGLRAASVQAPASQMPGFPLPPGFQQRLGKPTDFFFSGVFPAAEKRIGFIRIPVMAPTAGPEAEGIAQFAAEIAFMQTNTDGLVIDIMHNPGGSQSYVDALYSYISPQPFEQLHFVWRPTLYVLADLYVQMADAEANHADAATVAFYRNMYEQVEAANKQGADLSPPFPAIGTSDFREPARNAQGSVIAYTKPMMLLTDDVSISGADAFAAMFQDNRRGINFGVRTNGGGGNAEQFPAGWYSQAFAGSEINLAVRNHVLNVPGYPPTRYIDNVGVQPDIFADLMTKDNLLNQGKSFSQAMVDAITAYVRQQSGK